MSGEAVVFIPSHTRGSGWLSNILLFSFLSSTYNTKYLPHQLSNRPNERRRPAATQSGDKILSVCVCSGSRQRCDAEEVASFFSPIHSLHLAHELLFGERVDNTLNKIDCLLNQIIRKILVKLPSTQLMKIIYIYIYILRSLNLQFAWGDWLLITARNATQFAHKMSTRWWQVSAGRFVRQDEFSE